MIYINTNRPSVFVKGRLQTVWSIVKGFAYLHEMVHLTLSIDNILADKKIHTNLLRTGWSGCSFEKKIQIPLPRWTKHKDDIENNGNVILTQLDDRKEKDMVKERNERNLEPGVNI